MKLIIVSALGATLTIAALPALAGHGGGLEKCLHAASAVRPGQFAKVEYLSVTDEGGTAYEIEVAASNGTDWEFECDDRGRIIEMEQEVDSAKHPLFAAKMKVDEATARATALRLYPGTIDEVEYEIEMNGDASYEFDVIDEFGVEFKIEIDATTGDVVEVQVESWEIGIEDQEK